MATDGESDGADCEVSGYTADDDARLGLSADVSALQAEAVGCGGAVHLTVAVVVATGGAGALVFAADGSVVGGGVGHVGSFGQASADGAVVLANYAAVTVLGVGVPHAEGGRTDAVGHFAAIAARYAAVPLGTIGVRSIDIDAAGDGAASDGTPALKADDAADVAVAGEDGIADGKVVDFGFAVGGSEDANVTVVIVAAVPIDADTADGHVVAVEVAAESVVVSIIADGSKIGGRGAAAAVLDVVFETEVRVLVGRAAVDVSGKCIQVAGTGDFVRVGLGAAARPLRPRRLYGHGEYTQEQRRGCPPYSCAAQPPGPRRK